MEEMNEMMEMAVDNEYVDSVSQDAEEDATAKKLDEMNKVLPSWSLEPPKGFLK